MSELPARRMQAQRLTGEPFSNAVEAVGWFGAVQSQDYAGAKWGVGQRVRGASDSAIDRLFDEGAILRTHVMRPTWHFVLPDDIGWLLELTGPSVRRGLTARHRQLEIDENVVARAGDAFTAALSGGRHRTRDELAEVLTGAGIPVDEHRLPHLLLVAELTGLVTSGRRRGRQMTYALLSERAPGSRRLERTEALLELTSRYFKSHGPAQVQDFAWWSGLTAADVRNGISLARHELEHRRIDGRDYWFGVEERVPAPNAAIAHLLPNFDEYTVAYRDRSAALDPARPFDPTLFSFGSILANVVTFDGLVCGSWRRSPRRGGLKIEVRTLGRLDPEQAAGVERQVVRLGAFLQQPAELVLTPG